MCLDYSPSNDLLQLRDGYPCADCVGDTYPCGNGGQRYSSAVMDCDISLGLVSFDSPFFLAMRRFNVCIVGGPATVVVFSEYTLIICL